MATRSDVRRGPSPLERTAAPATAAMAAAAAALKRHLEVVLGPEIGDLTPEQRRVLEAGWRTARRLTALIDDLRTIALAETGALEIDPATIDLAELVTRAAERAWPAATTDAKTIRVDVGSPAPASTAEAIASRSLDALLEYAVEHARRDTEIDLRIESAAVELAYEAAQAPAGDELPFALVTAVCRLHGGDVTVAHEDGRTTLTLRFGAAGEDAVLAA